MNSLSRLKNSLANIQKRIDDTAEFYPTLDYSFHDAETLEDAVSTRPRAIKQFISLTHFYFHKNLIVDIREIRKLSTLKQLKFLTLNGNPIEDDIPYLRSYVLCTLPGLRNFNRTTISRSDLKISIIWKTTNKNLLSKTLKIPTIN
ncbi:unnamed protein product [Rotaria magnacalcarata]|uniref:Uncharacterized protein n=1 Tax=Rotaria magnacalcarata TaxID=392030 RepID=A0A8S2NI22_9BILA|nr:unnamed protein product [Rotaria magnacalcarata]CAF4001969.1 unnamed protein product [Rotaria magnacalcarata]CAF4034016.1 unnamed protein product [Rotaria magnacalcarata]